MSTELNKKNIEILEEKVKYNILYWLHVELRKSIRLIFVDFSQINKKLSRIKAKFSQIKAKLSRINA